MQVRKRLQCFVNGFAPDGVPGLPNGVTDVDFIASDCYHLFLCPLAMFAEAQSQFLDSLVNVVTVPLIPRNGAIHLDGVFHEAGCDSMARTVRRHSSGGITDECLCFGHGYVNGFVVISRASEPSGGRVVKPAASMKVPYRGQIPLLRTPVSRRCQPSCFCQAPRTIGCRQGRDRRTCPPSLPSLGPQSSTFLFGRDGRRQ